MDDNKIFIIGANGQLGLALQRQYPNAKSADIDTLDITDLESVESFDWSNIDIILNAAAFTNVDGAETEEGRVTSWKVNASAVSNLTRVCRKYDMTMVHMIMYSMEPKNPTQRTSHLARLVSMVRVRLREIY